MKKIGQAGKNDFDQKQKEIELQHKSTVSKIKSEIWGDRLAFLQKMVKLAEEGKDESPNDKPTIKTQALAQESSQMMLGDDDEKASLKDKNIKKNQKTKGNKKKEDLIHRIDK